MIMDAILGAAVQSAVRNCVINMKENSLHDVEISPAMSTDLCMRCRGRPDISASTFAESLLDFVALV